MRKCWLLQLWNTVLAMPSKAGFSLVELMLVLALVALLFTLGSINFSFLHRIALRSELDSLHTICQSLQQRAMATNTKQQLIFNRVDNSYSFGGNTHQLPHYLQFGVISGVKGPPASPNRLVTNPITFKRDIIVFHPDGIISPGAVYLIDTDNQFLYALSSGIAQVSFLRLYRYRSRWEILI